MVLGRRGVERGRGRLEDERRVRQGRGRSEGSDIIVVKVLACSLKKRRKKVRGESGNEEEEEDCREKSGWKVEEIED